uniref:Uncharacterized protein n=1 Tax=Ditylenchus dipsaci TaxID=166011 RepID=A0A915DUZ7_9BILA
MDYTTRSVDLREIMEDKLQRLAQLAKDVGFQEMEFCMIRAMNSLEKKMLGDDDPIPFYKHCRHQQSIYRWRRGLPKRLHFAKLSRMCAWTECSLSESVDENRVVNGEQQITLDLHAVNHTPALPVLERPVASTPIAIVKEKPVLNWASNSLSNLIKVALSTTPTSPSSSSTHTWAKISTQSPDTSHPQSLKDIQADEIAFVTASTTPKPQKPISLVELEEQAILELESYYNTIHEEGTHFFVVHREKLTQENGDTKPIMSTHWRSSNGFI